MRMLDEETLILNNVVKNASLATKKGDDGGDTDEGENNDVL